MTSQYGVLIDGELKPVRGTMCYGLFIYQHRRDWNVAEIDFGVQINQLGFSSKKDAVDFCTLLVTNGIYWPALPLDDDDRVILQIWQVELIYQIEQDIHYGSAA